MSVLEPNVDAESVRFVPGWEPVAVEPAVPVDPKCNTPYKHQYRSAAAARRALREIRAERFEVIRMARLGHVRWVDEVLLDADGKPVMEKSWYRCPSGEHWHLTSQQPVKNRRHPKATQE